MPCLWPCESEPSTALRSQWKSQHILHESLPLWTCVEPSMLKTDTGSPGSGRRNMARSYRETDTEMRSASPVGETDRISV